VHGCAPLLALRRAVLKLDQEGVAASMLAVGMAVGAPVSPVLSVDTEGADSPRSRLAADGCTRHVVALSRSRGRFFVGGVIAAHQALREEKGVISWTLARVVVALRKGDAHMG
jgi:hypothetical protein